MCFQWVKHFSCSIKSKSSIYMVQQQKYSAGRMFGVYFEGLELWQAFYVFVLPVQHMNEEVLESTCCTQLVFTFQVDI